MSTNNIVLVEKKEKYQYFLVEKNICPEVCFTFNIKTTQLIRPLLDSSANMGGLVWRCHLSSVTGVSN